ncbi:BCCT family transporter [Alkalihalobacillus deserti]|uniref:BCCT family transporter n=1 Tax=Alkalihalobacillus deserti TaxID=2879466 RepID=UPI001D13D156|nr:BCCT family transporter [Alkalihalobacillus deserti]
MKKGNSVLYVSLTLIFSFILWGLISSKNLDATVSAVESFFTNQFGWLYLLGTSGTLVFLFYLAFSRFGSIKLGKDDDKPEFSNFTWFAFLFSAGTGIGLVFYGVAEPFIHFMNPPGETSSQVEAANTAMRYSYFHYGFNAWAIYGIVALALAYFKFRKNTSGLISGIFYPILGERVNGPLGKMIDIVTVLSTIFGVATTFGFGTVQIAGGISYLFSSIPNSIVTQFCIIGAAMLLYLLSAQTGLSIGMKYISQINIILSLILLIFVFIMGNPRFIMNVIMNGTGDYLHNLVKMSFFTEPFSEESSKWVQGWTVFYWAWYISWAPFIGSFIARVSKGRTIREFVIGVIAAPTVFGIIWFSTFGGAALSLELFSGIKISDVINTQGVEFAIFALLEQFPWSFTSSLLALILLFTYFVSSADSATYVLSVQTSGGNLNPSNWLKFIWGLMVAGTTALLLWVGGLNALQTTLMIAAFPVVVLMILMNVSLYKSLREEEIAGQSSKIHSSHVKSS